MLRHLAERHEVTLVSFVREDDLEEDVRHLQQYCREVIIVPMKRSRLQDIKAGMRSIVRGEPVVIARDDKSEMRSALQSLAARQRFDVIHADQTSMAQYGLYIRDLLGRSPRPTTILDQHNALYMVVRRQSQYEGSLWRRIWKREAKLLEHYEAQLCQEYDHIFTVTQNDRDALISLFGKDSPENLDQKMQVVPICVDPSTEAMLQPDSNGPNILFVGSMIWPPNADGVLWFTEQVFPLIADRFPAAHFTVVGKDPSSRLKYLADNNYRFKGNITLAGFVPELDEYLVNSRVFIVPLRAGGGMRVKIVHAWMKGIPIVSTTIGAEGLELQDGENILIADEPKEFADAIVRVLHSSNLVDRLRHNGRRTVERHYDYRNIYQAIDPIYDARS